MSAFDFDNFLIRLVAWIIERCAARTPALTLTAAADLWLDQAIEAQASDPYTVIRRYDGGTPVVPVAWQAIQVMTRGRDLAATMTRALAVYEAFLDDAAEPLSMQSIGGTPAYRINGLELQAPAAIGVAANNLHEVVFNIRNLSFVRTGS